MALAGRARDPCEGPLAACLLCLAIWAIIIHDVGVVQAADVAGNATPGLDEWFPFDARISSRVSYLCDHE
jgi:hypothetical protein